MVYKWKQFCKTYYNTYLKEFSYTRELDIHGCSLYECVLFACYINIYY